MGAEQTSQPTESWRPSPQTQEILAQHGLVLEQTPLGAGILWPSGKQLFLLPEIANSLADSSKWQKVSQQKLSQVYRVENQRLPLAVKAFSSSNADTAILEATRLAAFSQAQTQVFGREKVRILAPLTATSQHLISPWETGIAVSSTSGLHTIFDQAESWLDQQKKQAPLLWINTDIDIMPTNFLQSPTGLVWVDPFMS